MKRNKISSDKIINGAILFQLILWALYIIMPIIFVIVLIAFAPEIWDFILSLISDVSNAIKGG